MWRISEWQTSRWRGLGRQVHRLEGTAALVMDHAQLLDQREVLGLFGERAGASPAFDVGREGGAADRAEHDIASADHEVAFGVAGAQREFGRGGGDDLGDQIRVESDDQVVHLAPGCRQHVARARMEHAHPGAGEQPERGEMDVLDVIVRQHARPGRAGW